MSREYKITCTPLRDSELSEMFRKLPSPINRPKMVEVYNYRIEPDGYYFVDRLVDQVVASKALKVFIDAALSQNESISIKELNRK
jgi:hypothetical protein